MKAHGKHVQHFYDLRYFYLFVATMLQVFLSAFFPDNNSLPVNALVYSFFVLCTINLVRHDRRLMFIMLLFGIAGLSLVWLPEVMEIDKTIVIIQRTIVAMFIAMIIYHTMVQIIKSRKVDGIVIFGAITIYILFGMLGGEINLMIQAVDPGAFSGNVNINDSADLRYYSYVTITTLGYGDITPVSHIARAAAVFFSLTAQIYLAVIIAFIVGKLVAHSGGKSRD